MLLNHYEAVRVEAEYRRERITKQFRRANRRRTRNAEPEPKAARQAVTPVIRPA